MKLLLVIFGVVTIVALPSLSSGQQACGPAAVRTTVEVAGAEFTLADLLTPSSCTALVEAASRVRLGRAPVGGSVRVLESDEVRALFQKLTRSGGNAIATAWDIASLPERITVRRSGARASCAEIGKEILGALPAVSASMNFVPGQFDCGAAGRVPADSPLEPAKIKWNRTLSSWEISARCVRAQDCVPFLVRVRGDDSLPEAAGSTLASGALIASPDLARPTQRIRGLREALALGMPPLVRAGETATLIWDQAGIRLIVPVVCLEAGGAGQKVRVRVRGGSRVVPAVVESTGQLRAAG